MLLKIDTPKLKLCCSFCKKCQDEVIAIIQAESIFICNECVSLCNEMIRKFNHERDHRSENLMYPKEIRKKLDQEIIGQDHAKKVLSVAAFMHNVRINTGHGSKSNVLLVGPTGSGKTKLMQVLAEILDLPLAITDATTLTEAGYVGDDVESIVSRLLQVADYNVERAQRGIIYIDEIDKIARTSDNRSISRDVSGEGVQQALLKLIEGTIASVPQKSNVKHPNQDIVQINTKDILFICGGAFEGLSKILQSRMSPSSIGINSKLTNDKSDSNFMTDLNSHDLVKFGLIPELIGRLPIRVVLHHLTVNDLVKIITEPKSSIFNQYRSLLSSINIKLSITEGAARIIAEEAIKQKSGARGIRAILESALLDSIYDTEDDKAKSIAVDEEMIAKMISNKSNPVDSEVISNNRLKLS